jgi:hypothetical protein
MKFGRELVDLRAEIGKLQDARRRLRTVEDLAAHQQRLQGLLDASRRVLTEANLAGGPQAGEAITKYVEQCTNLQRQMKKSGEAIEKLKDYQSRFRQFVERADDIERQTGNMGPWKDVGEKLKKAGPYLTLASVVSCVAAKYEKLSLREGLDKGQAFVLALAQALAYNGATLIPVVAVTDVVYSVGGSVVEACGVEGATEYSVETVTDGFIELAAYAQLAINTTDQGAEAPVSMKRIEDLLQRIDERLVRATGDERKHLLDLQNRLQQMLKDKVNDP